MSEDVPQDQVLLPPDEQQLLQEGGQQPGQIEIAYHDGQPQAVAEEVTDQSTEQDNDPLHLETTSGDGDATQREADVEKAHVMAIEGDEERGEAAYYRNRGETSDERHVLKHEAQAERRETLAGTLYDLSEGETRVREYSGTSTYKGEAYFKIGAQEVTVRETLESIGNVLDKKEYLAQSLDCYIADAKLRMDGQFDPRSAQLDLGNAHAPWLRLYRENNKVYKDGLDQLFRDPNATIGQITDKIFEIHSEIVTESFEQYAERLIDAKRLTGKTSGELPPGFEHKLDSLLHPQDGISKEEFTQQISEVVQLYIDLPVPTV